MHLTRIACSFALTMATSVTALDCSIRAQPLLFGMVNPILQQRVDGTSQIEITCAAPSSVTIAVVSGVGGHQMTGPGAMRYDVFTDAARTHLWGDGVGTADVISASGTRMRTTIYGRLFVPRTTSPGTYTDTLTILISW